MVEENNLGQNISKLRGVLGEGRGENRYIATVPGRGYRFVADVKDLTEENGCEGTATEQPYPVAAQTGVALARTAHPERHDGVLRGRLWPAVFVGVLTATLGVGTFYLWYSGKRQFILTHLNGSNGASQDMKLLLPIGE